MRVELLRTPVDALSFEEMVARAWADDAEGAFPQLRVHRNILDLPFKTNQRGPDG
jgi:hypothetical protein